MNDVMETLSYREENSVAWVTMDRPGVLNAISQKMLDEFAALWAGLRASDSVRCVVVTGSGEKAFCTGLDRSDFLEDTASMDSRKFHFDEIGRSLGPKTNELWIPVIAAVNGIACGAAFYLLGEVDFIIASENATFFDPHVTTGITPVYESMHMLQKMPFHEIMRIALMGSFERMSAQRAHQVGLASELCPLPELEERARWAAEIIASQPAIPVQMAVRSLWAAREMTRAQSLGIAPLLLAIGNDAETAAAGQALFAKGARPDWKLR